MSLDAGLVEAIAAIKPYLGDVVLAGGWVPRVYAAIQTPLDDGGLLTTRDIDVAVPRRLGVRTRTIVELLEAAGFTCELGSVETLPVMHFVARRDEPLEHLGGDWNAVRCWHRLEAMVREWEERDNGRGALACSQSRTGKGRRVALAMARRDS